MSEYYQMQRQDDDEGDVKFVKISAGETNSNGNSNYLDNKDVKAFYDIDDNFAVY